MVIRRSPRTVEDLQGLDDEQLLSFINEWDAEHHDEDDWLVEINIEALAETFQSIFKDSILPDTNRFRFWLDNRERIERPIHVRAMIGGMQEQTDRLDESLSFCEWVLSHPDLSCGWLRIRRSIPRASPLEQFASRRSGLDRDLSQRRCGCADFISG